EEGRKPARSLKKEILEHVVRGESLQLLPLDTPAAHQERIEKAVRERTRQPNPPDELGDRMRGVAFLDDGPRTFQDVPELEQMRELPRQKLRPEDMVITDGR